MNRLSYGLAKACEEATGPRCRCRCGGALHGIARGKPYELPEDDPHYVHPEDAYETGDLFAQWREDHTTT